MNSQQVKKMGLPDKPGVYFFKMGDKILYIGKATSLADRVKSYFSKDLINTRGPALLDMTVRADKIEWQETDSVLEALILEANLIKKYKPKYNTKEKDNKSFNYVCITDDKLPKVLIIRGRGLNKKEYTKVYGPFPNGQQLKEAMKIIRRIFPYFDNDSNKKNNREFYKQLGLVPDIITASQKHQNSSHLPSFSDADKNFDVFVAQYKNNIKNLKLFFEGKKKSVISNLKKEMTLFASKKEFEKAGEIKKRIFALDHINDVALIKDNIVASQEYTNSSRFTLKGSDATQNLNNLASYHIYLDGGLHAPSEYIHQETIIRGDELHPVISMASIMAKISRDKIMANYAKEFPEYGFEKHAGYGTKAHYLAIKKHGQTPIHRKTFIH